VKILKLPKGKLDLFASVVQQFGELHAPVEQNGKYAFQRLARWSDARLELRPDHPSDEKAVPHSHAKHSTFRGSPFMVGSLARLTVNPRRLTGKLAVAMKRLKLQLPADNPMDNNKAQALELINDVERALEIIEQLLRDGVKDERAMPVHPRASTGSAITEAPRGLLIHSYTYDEEGRIVSADVVTPTALNAASIELHFRRAVEQCAERDEAIVSKRLQMIARAYDPCISCSVHLVRKS